MARGVDVVYDSISRDTFPQSLDCLKPRGLFASFGQSSGAIENFTMAHLAQRARSVPRGRRSSPTSPHVRS